MSPLSLFSSVPFHVALLSLFNWRTYTSSRKSHWPTQESATVSIRPWGMKKNYLEWILYMLGKNRQHPHRHFEGNLSRYERKLKDAEDTTGLLRTKLQRNIHKGCKRLKTHGLWNELARIKQIHGRQCTFVELYLLSLALKGTTWIPRGPPPLDTSTGFNISLGTLKNEGNVRRNKTEEK